MWENSIVVVLSDHGEEFWEHSSAFAAHHEASLYGEVLRVPFLIRDPDLRNEGMTFWDDDVTSVDLLPTVADLLRVPLTDSCDGVSLRTLMRGGTLERRVPLLSLTYPTTCPEEHWPSRPCIVAAGAKHIPLLEDYNGECADALAYPMEEQLYLLDSDPGETDNRAVQMPELKQLLSKHLREGLAAAAQSPPCDESGSLNTELPADLQKQLEALGYLDRKEE
jgi:arylsulfatase A-like enzyme